MQRPTWLCQLPGEMNEMDGDLDGEAMSARDYCAAVGDGFVDQFCPLCILSCGQDQAGAEVKVHCLVVGDIKGRLLICLPCAAWHRSVAKRTVRKGFLTRVFGAEVAVVSITDRAAEVSGQTVRVWLGYCEPEAEGSLEGSVWGATDWRAAGALCRRVSRVVASQQTGGLSTPMQSASEGLGSMLQTGWLP